VTTTSNEVCRLTVVGPSRQVDLAVPANVVVTDLLPVLLSQLGEDLADAGMTHGGWVLQRVGRPAFDEDRSVASLGLRDGDVVHVRPRADQLPPVDFDDLIDGVAAGARERTGKWSETTTRTAATMFLALVLVTGAVLLLRPGPYTLRSVVAAVIAVGCLLTAWGVGRVESLASVGILLAAGAVGYAFVAGLLVSTPPDAGSRAPWHAPQVFTATTALIGFAVIAIASLGFARHFLVGMLTSGIVVWVAAVLATFTGLAVVRVAAVIAVGATTAVTLVPMIAFRLSGLRLAPLPTAPEHLQEDLEPVPSEMVLDHTARADRYMTALYAGLAVPVAAALAVLAASPGWSPPMLAGLAALVLALASRPMTSAWHRLALLGAAAVAVIGIAIDVAAMNDLTGLVAPGLGVPAAIVAGVLAARYLPGRRLMPYWGQIGDITLIVAAIAMLPVFLAVLDVYSRARAIGG